MWARDDTTKCNCRLVKKVLEDNRSLKSAKLKICVVRKDIFVPRKADGTVTKINNYTIGVVDKFYNDLNKSQDQPDISLHNHKKSNRNWSDNSSFDRWNFANN